MSGPMLTLALLRHAEAIAKHPSGDSERVLSQAGRRAAVNIGLHLMASLPTPVLLLVSDAVRTRQTAELAFPAAGRDVTTRLEVALYAASADTILSCLHGVEDRHPTVVIVGHNPGIGDLAGQIVGEGPATGLAQLQSGFPPAAAAIFTLNGSWSEVGLKTGKLLATFVPDGTEWPV